MKWYVATAFGLLMAVLLGFYLHLAGKALESDRLSRALETQQTQLTALAAQLRAELESASLLAKAIASAFDTQTGRLAPGAEALFWDNPLLVAVRVMNAEKAEVFRLEKKPKLLDEAELAPPYFSISTQAVKGDGNYPVSAVIEMKDPFTRVLKGQTLQLLAADGKVLRQSSSAPVPEAARKHAGKNIEVSFLEQAEAGTFLISYSALNFGGLSLAAAMDARATKDPVREFTKQTAVFAVFALLAIVAFSGLVTGSLTRRLEAKAIRDTGVNLEELKAQNLARGREEVLVQAREFADKNLLPEASSYNNANVRLYGLCRTGWWFYFQSGHELYVVLAELPKGTGEVAAALISAELRSAVAHLRRGPFTLKDVARALDATLAECAAGARANALLAHIHTELGDLRVLHAGIDSFVHVRAAGNKFQPQTVSGRPNPPLGGGTENWVEDLYTLNPGDRCLFTTLKGEWNAAAEKVMAPNLAPSTLVTMLDKQSGESPAVGAMIALDFKAVNR